MNLGSAKIISNGSNLTLHGYSGGIDYGSIIDFQMEVKQKSLEKVTEKIEIRSQSIAAINDLKNEVEKLQEIAKKLTGENSIINSTPSAFNTFKTSISNPSENKPENYYVDVTTDGNPIRKEFDIKVNQIASHGKYTSLKVPSLDATLSELNTKSKSGIGIYTGTEYDPRIVSFRKTGENFADHYVDIEIREDDSIRTIAQKINNTRCDVEAYTRRSSGGGYVLELISRETGEKNSIESIIDIEKSNAISGFTNFFCATSKEKAKDSEVEINGEVFSHHDRVIIGDEIGLDGTIISVNHVQKSDEKPISVLLSPDTDAILNDILEFFNQYNTTINKIAIQRTVKKDDELDPDSDDPLKIQEYKEEKAKLGSSNRLLNDLYSKLLSNMHAVINDSAIPSIGGHGGLGFEFTTSTDAQGNTLLGKEITGHADMLRTKLQKQFEDVNTLFTRKSFSTSPYFSLSKAGSNLQNIKDFEVNFDGLSYDKTATISYRLNNSEELITFKADVKTIVGGSSFISVTPENIKSNHNALAFKGCEILYNGPQDQEHNTQISLSRGIADLIHSSTEIFLSKEYPDPKNEGPPVDRFTAEIKSKISDTEKDRSYITKKKQEFDTYRKNLLSKYANAESQAMVYQNIQDRIKAWSDSNNNS